MTRVVVAALAAVIAVPASVRAQAMQPEPPWGSRVRITPFVAQAPTVSREERWTVFENGFATADRLDVSLGAGAAAGLSVEVLLVDRFAAIASGALLSRGRTTEFSLAQGDFLRRNGSNFALAKLAAAMRLREAVSELQFRQLTATVFAGPAYIREMPKDDVTVPSVFLGTVSHWGANFGIDAEIPIGSRGVALQAGVEDYLIWWNNGELARRNDVAFAGIGRNTDSYVDTDRSHMFLFRIGLSFKFD
jgi:hypothetical protein